MKYKINNEQLGQFLMIWPYIEPFKKRIISLILLPVLIGATEGLMAWLFKPFIDIFLNKNDTFHLVHLIPVAIILLGTVQGGLNYLLGILNTKTSIQLSSTLKLVIFQRLMQYDAHFFDKETSGNIQTRFNHDVDNVCGGLLGNFKSFTTQVASIISLIGVIFVNSWILALFSIIILGIAISPLKNTKSKLKALISEQTSLGSVLSTHYNETFSGNRIITSFNLENFQIKKFQRSLNDILNISKSMSHKINSISFKVSIFMSICIALTFWTGGYLVNQNMMSVSNFMSFFTAFLLLFKSIKGIGSTFQGTQVTFLALERLSEILKNKPGISNNSSPKKLTKNHSLIEYKNVSFEYLPGIPVLNNINFSIKKGEIIAVVGNSGGGKTTFANLLPRFYDISSGCIAIDDIDIKDYDLKSLRDQISVVFQDNFLFSGTIRQNIVLDQENITEEQLNQAIKNACLDKFIGSLPDGLNTEIGERGIRLSGGQKQRIAIARVFVKDSSIVIFDEATSALDNQSEIVVQNAISRLMKGRTVIIIAHRLSTIRNADKIIVFNNGEIVEHGTHQELLNHNQYYASLYSTQIHPEAETHAS